jgi:hypothetical protein
MRLHACGNRRLLARIDGPLRPLTQARASDESAHLVALRSEIDALANELDL